MIAWKDCIFAVSSASFLASAILERKCLDNCSTSSGRMISASFWSRSTSVFVSICSSLSARLFFQRRLSFKPLEVFIDSIRSFIFSTQRLLAWILARIFLLIVLARISSKSSLSLSLSSWLCTLSFSSRIESSSLNFTTVPWYFAETSIRFILISRKEVCSSRSWNSVFNVIWYSSR